MFKVGQKIVAIKDHTQGLFRKGEVFTVLGVSKTPCCKLETVDIGFLTPKGRTLCARCNHKRKSDIWWMKGYCFVPVQEEFQSITLTKIMEFETPFISAN